VIKHRTSWSVLFGCVVSLSILASASESTTCTGTVSRLVPDGRIVRSSIPDATTFFWQFDGFAGKSYSIELTSEVDNGFPASIIVYNTVDDCTTLTSTLTLNVNTGTDPVLLSTGLRRSFIAPNNGSYIIRMTNTSGAAHLYNLRVTDTTLYNPRWSTYSGFITQWGFRNTTNTAINVTLTASRVLPPGASTPITFAVPAHGEVFKLIAATGGDINVGANQAGYAEAAHDGPPGAIAADAYFINANATVIVPSPFEPRNSVH
jgi:hypothetical protein